MADDIFAEMETDALANVSSIASDEQLTGIAALAQNQIQLEDSIANTEEYLKDLKRQLQHISTQIIPDAFAEAGLSDFTTKDGLKVEISSFVSASITEAKKEEAHAWLQDNGFGDIIKHMVSVNTGKDSKLTKKVLRALEKLPINIDQKESVHVGTLKAFLREQVPAGTPVPLELFGAYLGQKTTIRRIKKDG